MLQKSTTLVVVTRDRLIRADFAGATAAEPTALAIRERPHIDETATLVEMALAAERRKPGRTFVLLADAWTHTLGVAATTTHGMSSAELLQTLAFEAEPLSNMSAFESVTATTSLGETAGQRLYWITQIPTAVRDQIQDAVRAAGGRLAGVLHPGGVPQTLEEQPPAVLSGRVEYWPGATLRIVAREGVVTRARVDDSGSAAGWYDAVDSWKRESGAGQAAALVAEGRLPLDAAADEYFTLSDETVLRRWLAAWNRTLAAKEPAVPVVPAEVKPFSKQQRAAISVVLAIAALGVCYGHTRWIESELSTIAAEKTRLAAPGQQIALMKTQAATIEKDMKTTSAERDKLAAEVKQAEEVFDSHRRRLSELLRRLADDSNHDWVLQRIDGTGREVKLTGVTMHPEHISVLAEGMSTDLQRLGWTVDPPKQTARNQLDDGGPWTFELRLHDHAVPKGPAGGVDGEPTPLQGTVVGAER